MVRGYLWYKIFLFFVICCSFQTAEAVRGTRALLLMRSGLYKIRSGALIIRKGIYEFFWGVRDYFFGSWKRYRKDKAKRIGYELSYVEKYEESFILHHWQKVVDNLYSESVDHIIDSTDSSDQPIAVPIDFVVENNKDLRDIAMGESGSAIVKLKELSQ